MSQTVVIGVGGTGAKIIEAAVHLAASGNMPEVITPVIVDQDAENGNLIRCRDTIGKYQKIKNLRDEKGTDIWADTPFFNTLIRDLVEINPKSVEFKTAIRHTEISDSGYGHVIEALFNKTQWYDTLSYGYAKRAHMGSVLIRKEFKQRLDKGYHQLKSNLEGLGDQDKIVVCGSIFGGTGASGIVTIGKLLRHEFPGRNLCTVMMLPYFAVATSGKKTELVEKYKNLVNSNSDFLSVKNALQMYISDGTGFPFNHAAFLGDSSIENEIVTENLEPGGRTQENPSHIFEALAALILNRNNERTSSLDVFVFEGKQPGANLGSSIKKFAMEDFLCDKNLNRFFPYNAVIIKDFAGLIVYLDQLENEKKRERYPLYWNIKNDFSNFLNWAHRHCNWWKEISYSHWRRFKYNTDDDLSIKSELFCSYIDRLNKSSGNNPKNLANALKRAITCKKINKKYKKIQRKKI